jgi:FMN phosphatase YigB (HAD superfamily)
MPITLLLDLDDTLLETNMDAFIPAYFKALAAAVADKVSPEVLIQEMMVGTKAMMSNLDPALTLQEVFDAQFFPRLGTDRAALRTSIDHFYDEVFPSLKSLTKPIPEAVRLVDWALAQGHRVVIATNPFFPLKAILHRLRWAGLPPEKYPFTLVTSYENFHFTKETVAYYPEILAQIGWPDDPVVMVGDDIEREVKPTQAAGFPVYWVHESGDVPREHERIPRGKLGSFQGWLEKSDPEDLKINLQAPLALLATLRSTPAALATLARSVPSETWTRKPVPGEWSLTEILCHLRDVERAVNIPRISKILSEENPFLAGEDTDHWVADHKCSDQIGAEILFDFVLARKETINLLKNLKAEWSRTARHAIFGPTTLVELVGIIVGHDRVHVQQIWKTIHNGW